MGWIVKERNFNTGRWRTVGEYTTKEYAENMASKYKGINSVHNYKNEPGSKVVERPRKYRMYWNRGYWAVERPEGEMVFCDSPMGRAKAKEAQKA